MTSESIFYGTEVSSWELVKDYTPAKGWRPSTARLRPPAPGRYSVIVRSDEKERQFLIHNYRWTGAEWRTPAGTSPVLRVIMFKGAGL